MQTSTTVALLAVITTSTGCGRPDFDGLYRVESYAVVDGDCTGASSEIEPEFSQFQIREREWFGVTLYPLYPCDGAGNCDTENDGDWALITTADDSDEVSMTIAYNDEDACVLSSIEVLIGDHTDPARDAVVIERRVNEVAVEPYVAHECTTDRAKAMRSQMHCVEALQIVGEREPTM